MPNVNLESAGPVKFKALDESDSSDWVAGVTGKKIRVLALAAKFASSTTLKLQSGASADLTGAMTGTDFNWPFNPTGWCETAAAAKLNGVHGTTVQLSGVLVYQEV